MTQTPAGPEWLTVRDVADRRRVKVGTVYRYHGTSTARLRRGLPLRPMDLPVVPPRDRVGPRRELRWRADGPIAAWLARTEPTRKDPTP